MLFRDPRRSELILVDPTRTGGPELIRSDFCTCLSLRWTFWDWILLSGRIVSCRTISSVANSLRKQRKKFNIPRKWRSSQLLRSQQANSRSRKQLFRINCPITNLWNKQTVSRPNFFPCKASKNSSRVKSKKTEEVNKVRYECFLRASEFLGEVS